MLKGRVVLSGYPSPLYNESLQNWRRMERSARNGAHRQAAEVVWMNRQAATQVRNGALPRTLRTAVQAPARACGALSFDLARGRIWFCAPHEQRQGADRDDRHILRRHNDFERKKVAPRAGLEPATIRLTVERSTD